MWESTFHLTDPPLETLSFRGNVISKQKERERAGEREAVTLHIEELLTYIDALEGLVYVSDLGTHRLLAVNRYCEERFGEDLVGKTCYEALRREQGKPCSFCTNNMLVGSDGEPASPVIWCFDDIDGGRFYRCVDRAIHWSDGRLVRMSLALDITEFRDSERSLKKSVNELRERVKELNCLYAISKLLEEEHDSLEEVFKGVVDLIPPGWQYPEITCARITFGDTEVKTENFRETEWVQKKEIFTDGGICGTLEVGYLEKRPERYEGPFLREERLLIQGIAEKLGKIIELVTAQNELKLSQERFNLAVEGSYDGLWDWPDINQDAEWWSPQWYALLGYEDGEIEASFSHFRSILHPHDLGRMEEAVRAHFEEDVPFDMEYRLRIKSGEYRWFRGRGKVTRDSDGKPVRMSGSIRDINDIKLAEEGLKKSRRVFADLVEKSLTGIVIIQDHRVVYTNPEFRRMVGPFPTSYFIPSFKGIHPEDVEKIRGSYNSLLEEEQREVDTDFRFYPMGSFGERSKMKWVLCRGSITEHDGHEAIMLNMMDVTRIKGMEEAMLLQSKMASLGRMAAGIAHEIRNPLAGVNIYLDALETSLTKAKESEKVGEIVKKISSTSQKIEAVINRVMDFSKPSEPKLTLADIHKPIVDALSLASVSLRRRGITVQKSLAKNIPPCLLDTVLMEQVMLNLIGNAAEAMKGIQGERKIGVRSFLEGEKIFVGVSDSGPGVPLHLRAEVFDPFFTTKENNAGIGLSICNRIVTDHGGSIIVGESIWGGAEFVVEIPVGRQKAQDG